MPLPSAISQIVNVMGDLRPYRSLIGDEQCAAWWVGDDADPEGRGCQKQAGQRVVRREEHTRARRRAAVRDVI
jgi:hypothetical protein